MTRLNKLCKYHLTCEHIDEQCYDDFTEKCVYYNRFEGEKVKYCNNEGLYKSKGK